MQKSMQKICYLALVALFLRFSFVLIASDDVAVKAHTAGADLTIIVQGPLNLRSLGCIAKYSLLASRVIVVHYCDGVQKPLRSERAAQTPNVHFVELRCPQLDKTVNNLQNRFLQWYGMAVSTSMVQTKFSIKVRSDACWNLTHMIDRVLVSPEKYTTVPIFFRPFKQFSSIHPSDHVIGSSTALLQGASFRSLSTTFQQDEFRAAGPCEIIFGQSFLQEKGWYKYDDLHRTLMENFVIVPLESMEPFHFVAHAGKPDYAEYKNPAEFYNSQVELPSVRSLDEVIQL